MNERIKQVRKHVRMTQAEFGEHLGVGRMSVAYYENGTRQPSGSVIKAICNNYGVSYDWLVYGDGEMFQDDSIEGRALVDALMDSEDNQARQAVVNFAKLGEEKQKVLLDLLKEITKEG